MKVLIKDRHKCGIYIIRNLINGKVYIGKSVNIYNRITSHISTLTLKRAKGENPHFISAWHKYGRECFGYSIVEECSVDMLKERELYWMVYYESTNPNKGYNKRIDSEGGMVPHKDTRKKLSDALKNRKQTVRDLIGEKVTIFWKNNPDIKKQMSINVKIARQKKYKFIQLFDDNTVFQEYDSVEEIIQKNPTYKWQNIYSVCNGYKKKIYGYKWIKELKI